MELGLANKTALVTGGSKGIGLETARALAREGVKVLICARRESALAEAARDIMQTTQATVETQSLDVTKLGRDRDDSARRQRQARPHRHPDQQCRHRHLQTVSRSDRRGTRRRHGDQFLRTIPHLSANSADDDRPGRWPDREYKRSDRDHDVSIHRFCPPARDRRSQPRSGSPRCSPTSLRHITSASTA